MNDDWLVEREEKQIASRKAAASEFLEKRRADLKEAADRREREAFYEANKDQVEAIYKRFLSCIDRAAAVGLTVNAINRWGATLSIEYGPCRSFSLTPQDGGLKGTFFDQYGKKSVLVDKHFSFADITDRRLSSWARWLTAGEGTPWKWSLFG